MAKCDEIQIKNVKNQKKWKNLEHKMQYTLAYTQKIVEKSAVIKSNYFFVEIDKKKLLIIDLMLVLYL